MSKIRSILQLNSAIWKQGNFFFKRGAIFNKANNKYGDTPPLKVALRNGKLEFLVYSRI